jgi:hypothetical protein
MVVSALNYLINSTTCTSEASSFVVMLFSLVLCTQEALLNALLRSDQPPQELAEFLCAGLTSDCGDTSLLDVSMGLDGESHVVINGAGGTTHKHSGIGSESMDRDEAPELTPKKKKKKSKKRKGKKRAAPLGGSAPPEGSAISAVPGN